LYSSRCESWTLSSTGQARSGSRRHRSEALEVSELYQKLPDLMRAKRAFSACKLFDPFFLASDPSINALNALADELVHFGYPEFDEDFIKGDT
jgi:hypothetical protein